MKRSETDRSVVVVGPPGIYPFTSPNLEHITAKKKKTLNTIAPITIAHAPRATAILVIAHRDKPPRSPLNRDVKQQPPDLPIRAATPSTHGQLLVRGQDPLAVPRHDRNSRSSQEHPRDSYRTNNRPSRQHSIGTVSSVHT